jgi:hypothetical protein
MAADRAPTAAETVAAKEKPAETFSQFVARVLDQLELSAWLPSAAMVLQLYFIVQLGTAVDAKRSSVTEAVGVALSRMGATGIGGGVLLAVAVVVLTILTQAFTFESIRFLEGYWGTARLVERIAGYRVSLYCRKINRLSDLERCLTKQAWDTARERLIKIQNEIRRTGHRPDMTPAMIDYLAGMVLQASPSARPARLTSAQRERLSTYKWEALADGDQLRRRVNVIKQLQDYPARERALPTRLGNILRAYEDQLDADDLDGVESYMQRIYDSLPASFRENHDQQRNRLDLYCTMVFVVAISGLVAVARFAPRHWPYAVGAACVAAIGMWTMYRAALATARAYGQLLITSAAVAGPLSSAYADAESTDEAEEQATP